MQISLVGFLGDNVSHLSSHTNRSAGQKAYTHGRVYRYWHVGSRVDDQTMEVVTLRSRLPWRCTRRGQCFVHSVVDVEAYRGIN
jgi:hypothetical protein